ncbi:peptidoglycan-binding protein [Leptolyngbya cf. ectocarpi LEGE 11479]|uniref:Peptidoglycan-binding protein n=1 Tax=Leptolyngbya cf. ectocarpi LEGE 11479 TaxID=1828722 RepID=A0A928ZWL7_LEPEC|nr:peptidoglycan-binding protein [Leptolyngbya ectocarpi]MBE9068789.1 peptidoglycan-binding protein [Leptolyngbya cf. ectocarpi LEGE 11479]
MKIKHLNSEKQQSHNVVLEPVSESSSRANCLSPNLKKIISISAGCTLLTGLANSQAATVYACEAVEDNASEANCQTQEREDVDVDVDVSNLNAPSVQQNLKVQWSTASADDTDKPVLVSDGAIAVEQETATEADQAITVEQETAMEVDQALSEDDLEPLPTSRRIYGDTIDLQEGYSGTTSVPVLERGARGDVVSRAQQKLNEAGITVKVDGIFGKATQQAVREFQKSQNLPQNGVVDSETSKALFGSDVTVSLSPTAGIPKAGVGKASTSIQNIASASSQETDYANDAENVSVVRRPAVGINKSIVQVFDPDGTPDDDGVVDEAGDMIRYSIKVKNAGNVTLTGVTVDDPLTGGILTTDATLDVGTEQTFTADYTVTQTDMDNNGAGLGFKVGSIDNEATVISNQTGLKLDTEAVPVKQTPAIKVNKSAVGIDTKNDGRLNQAGDIIEFIIEIENTGNQTLNNVAINDPQLGIDRVIGQLAPGATQTFIGRYRLTQADIDSNGGGDGDIDNTVEVTTAETGLSKDFAEVKVEQNPDIKVEKRVIEQDSSGDGTLNNAGEKVIYEVIVTNTGNQTLTNVSIQDSLLGSWIIRGITLAPGASRSFSYDYIVSQAALDG